MSTKTTLKRIALVAVSVLGFGLLSVIPAKAALGGTGFSPGLASVAPTGSVTTRLNFTGAVTDVLATSWTAGSALTTFSWRVLEVAEGVNVSAMSGTGTSAPVFTVTDTSAPLSTTKFALIRISTSSAATGAGVIELTSPALGGGADLAFTVSVITAGTASVPAAVVNGTDTPLRIQAGQSNVTASDVSNLNAITAASTVAASTNTLKLFALEDTVSKAGSGSYRAVQVSGSTISAVTGKWVLDGAPGTATRAFAPLDGDLAEAAINISSIAFAAGVSTYTTAANHLLSVGDYLNISGTTAAANSGLFVVASVPTATTFTVANASGVAQAGAVGTVANHGQIWVAAATAGTVTISFIDRSAVTATSPFLPATSGQYVETTLQTITLTVSAAPALSAQQSTSFIAAKHNTAGVATDTEDAALDFTEDQEILAPAKLAGVGAATSVAGTAKAVIQVNLKDAAGLPLVGTLPAVGATIAGPGTLSIGTSPDADGSTGRSLAATAAPASTFYINVFSDGTSGTSTISILVGGAVWTTKTMKFYTTPTKVTATQGLKVLKANTVSGCVGLANCNGTTVDKTVAVKVVATDANGIPVPFLKYKVVSSDATILLGAATAISGNGAVADYLGANWYTVASTFGAASGTSASLTYTTALTATTDLSSDALKFTIGGAPTSASLAISTGSNVGDKGTMTISVKDASGNSTYDADHTLALTTSVALTTALGQILPAGNPIMVVDGKATIDFFNPIVSSTVNLTGLVSGLLPVAGSFTVSNSAVDAATDAAAEAIDAANAATDAANLAAEAADAATVAAEEARDAADAATAAVEELATQVATLMAALKAQITTLANTVAKIAKKVKA